MLQKCEAKNCNEDIVVHPFSEYDTKINLCKKHREILEAPLK